MYVTYAEESFTGKRWKWLEWFFIQSHCPTIPNKPSRSLTILIVRPVARKAHELSERQDTSHPMPLHLLPHPCAGSSKQTQRIPYSMTHRQDQPCPLTNDHELLGLVTTCCTFPGYRAVRELRALGKHRLAAKMFTRENMTPSDACAFARELEAAIGELKAKYTDPFTWPRGSRWDPVWHAERREWECHEYMAFRLMGRSG